MSWFWEQERARAQPEEMHTGAAEHLPRDAQNPASEEVGTEYPKLQTVVLAYTASARSAFAMTSYHSPKREKGTKHLHRRGIF